MKKVIVLGGCNIDVVMPVNRFPYKGEKIKAFDYFFQTGGAGATQAISIKKLGIDIKFITLIGDDQFGQHAISDLKDNNINTDYFIISKKIRSNFSFIVVNKEGENFIVSSGVRKSALISGLIDNTNKSFVKDGIFLTQFDFPYEVVKEVLRIAKQKQMITILKPAPAEYLDDDMISSIDILIMNETEVSLLTGKNVRHAETAIQAGKLLIERGIKRAVITLGRGGVLFFDGDDYNILPANIVDVVDVTAAGDSFIGAFVSKLAENKSFKDAVEFANYAAALTVSRFGGISSLPDQNEVDTFICERKAGIVYSEKYYQLSTIEMLANKANEMRILILEMLAESGSGHPGGSLSIVEIITVLYFYEMFYDPQNPKWKKRDRFVLSKGHACPALYAALAMVGFFDKSELMTLRKLGSILQGHPDMRKTPGVDFSTGSLGQGFSGACGMAIGLKLNKERQRVYVILGDGEIEEGQVWEAAMTAVNRKLDNLCVFLDYNGLQIDGAIGSIKPALEPLSEKWEAFGWNVEEIDGHDIRSIISALASAKKTKGKPTIIIAHTVKGKGVSFMERMVEYHGASLTREEVERAVKELKKR